MTKHRDSQKHVVIVGGGITGLSAAWYLQTKSNLPLAITLVEAEQYLGGKMRTQKIIWDGDEFIIDAGPESFVTRKPEAWQLAQELGLDEEVIDPGSETKNMYVLDQGEPKKIPLSPPAFVMSDLLSWNAKLRMLIEPIIPPRTDDEDESLADFVTRRLGKEALEKMLGPVLAGIYNTDPNTQSIMTTSPVMREMEKEHGGLFRGAIARMRARRKDSSDGPRPPQFVTFKTGAQVLVDALAAQLDAEILTGASVLTITRDAQKYQVALSNQETIAADAVILAAPANQSSKMLAQMAPDAAELLGKIDHEHIGTAALIFKEGDLQLPYAINGLMIPRREKRKIDAVTWTTNKPISRAPEGYEMIRVFFGGGDPEVVTLSEDQIIQTILDELKDILGIDADPVEAAVFCWEESFPQAYVGHLSLVDEIDAELPEGIWVAGSSFRGIGVPDCIRQGKRAAEKTLDYFGGR